MPFAALGLAPELVRAVADEGYAHPTPIQSEAIPLALAGRDLIGSAQTGTGKTAAFVLPILQRLAPGPRGTLRALVLVPTRELAEQVATSIRAYGRHTHLKGAAVYGGVGMEPQTRALKHGADIVVATPGRLLDHLERGHVDFSKVEVLVLDEAGQTLIFTRTKYGADKLVTFLRREGITANALHGDKAQSHRTRTLDQFRSGTAEILVATDIAARGIDVDGIRMVVNYDVPTDPEVYVHRVGRTARAGARGLALTLISPDEWLLMADVEKLIGQTFPREVIPGFEPSVAPLQPRPLQLEIARPTRSVRARVGGRRRR